MKVAKRDIEEAVEEIVEAVDEHTLSSPEVPRSVTIEFLRGITSSLLLRIKTIATEEAGDPSDEGELDGWRDDELDF